MSKPDVIEYRTEVKRDTITVVDTAYIEKEPIRIKETVVVRDTIIKHRDRFIETEVAEFDTTFKEGSKLEISYYLSPRVFDIKYDPAPVEIRTVTETVTETIEIRPNPWKLVSLCAIGVVIGIVIG